MTHPSKTKGNTFEREIVNQAIAAGLPAERAYASNGRALGHAEDVDCLVGGFRVQAKRRKCIASFMQPSETVDLVALRQDRGETLVVMRYEDWLNMAERNQLYIEEYGEGTTMRPVKFKVD